MATPTDLHSSIFSADSAGKDDDPGNVIPRASAALAIVLAVYIFGVISIAIRQSNIAVTHTTTGTWPGTGMSHGIIAVRFGLGCLPVLQILSV